MNMNSRILYLSVLLFVIGLCDSKSKYGSSSPSECGFVYLTVSSLVTNKWKKDPYEDDKLELNWDLTQCSGVQESDVPNKVALYNVNPETARAQPMEIVDISDHKWNYYVTKFSVGPLELPTEWTRKVRQRNKTKMVTSGPQCLPFWIASFRDTKLLRSNCLKIHPTWMADIRESVADTPLSRLLIPGTHNAGSYAYGPASMRTVLQRYVLCQDRDLWTQLVSGIRYLDFRIAYYDTLQSLFVPQSDASNRFWLNHNMIKVTPLLPLFKDIRRFLESTTDEIIILDIHQLPVGFYQSNEILLWRHHLLLDLLKAQFAEHILSFDEVMLKTRVIVGPTISDILKTGKRLIIGYPDGSVINQNRWLWPSVRHMWGNTNDPYILKDYLDGVMKSPPRPTQPGSNPLWSAMAQTTPTALDVLLNTEGSLRKMADAVNRNLTSWVHHDWWDKANIVATDFYMGNNLIEIMTHLNSFKGRLMKTDVGKILFSN